MTKNISTKTAHKGGHKVDKKSSSQANTTNATTIHSQNEIANSAPVQKASIDSKMLTAEQRRLASLMNDKVDVTDIEKKINKIIELTGASKDKAIVALHDCANELEKAIDMILEGDSINESEWKSQARKKKPKTVTGKESDNKLQLNGHTKKSKATGRQPRNNKQQNDKQFTNRSERTNKKEFKPREQNNNDESTNNKEFIPKNEPTQQNEEENDDWQEENQSQQQPPPPPSYKSSFNNRTSSSNDNQFKSSFKSNTQDRDRRPNVREYSNREYNNREYNNREGGQRGDRNYNNRSNYGQSNDRQFNQRGDRKPFPSKTFQPRKPAGERNQFTNSIDTWTNDSTNQTTTNNDYAQMTVGNWSDVVSSTIQQKTSTVSATATVTQDKLNNEEWVEASSNLIEKTSTVTKVFSKDSQNNNNTSATSNQTTTINKEEHQKTKMPNLASIVSGVKPIPQVQQPTPQQSSLNKSQNQKPSINQLSGANQTSTSNNHPQLTSSQQTNLHKSSSQQRSPQQQQQNKIDLASLLKSPANQQQQSNQQTNTSNLLNRANNNNIPQPQRSNDTNAYGAAILQHLQRPQIVNNETNKSSNINDYVNQYNNQQMINKNLVHNIPSNNNYTQNSSNQLFDSRLHHQNVNDQQSIQDHHQKSLIEKTKRKHTKIPETAVEMPSSDHISSLNVQFGALDFGTDSYLNDNTDKQQNSSILSSIRGDNQFRNNQNQSNTSDKQHTQSKQDNLHNQLDQHQLQDNILQDNRNKQQQQQITYQQKTAANSLYGSNQTTSNDNNSTHQSIYPPNLAQQYGYGNTTSNASANAQSNYSVNNYGQQNQQHSNNQTANQSANQQKIDQQQTSSTSGQKLNLKDLDITSTNSSTNNNSNLINTSLGSAVTTNVLKNSITATGKNIQPGNVAQQPNVAPLLGTPQYIMNMSQPGLSAFYPIVNYDVPQMTADHSFRYNQNQQDVKYNRTDANDNVGQTNPHNVQSTQAQVNQQPNHQIFSQIGQFPHPYGFFYTTGMMAQGLYPSTAPFLPVQPNAGPPSSNQHTNSSHSTGFPPKAGQNQQYSSYSSNAYDPLTAQLQNQQDYNKAAAQQNYGNAPTQTSNNQQQTGKQMSNNSSNELNNSNMYTKSHAQLTKNYDKPGFQTPPPFGMTQLGYNPNTYIPMMQPQSNPSMLHHTLQTDANQSVNSSGVTGSQRGSLSQKQTASNSKNNYYNNWS